MTKLFYTLIIVFSALNPAKDAFTQPGREWNDPAFSPRLAGEVVNYNVPSRGSQYLFQDWLPGTVYLHSGAKVSVAGLRYNGHRNTIIWRHPKTHNHIRLDDKLIKEFEIIHPQRKARFIRFTAPGSRDPVWAECLYVDEISLLADRKISQTGSLVQQHEGSMVSLPVLEPRPRYYVVNAKGDTTRISRLNRRNLQNAFPGDERAVRELLRENSLRVQNETELVAAIRLINSMLTRESNN